MGSQKELVVSTSSVLFMLPPSIQQLGKILPSSLLDEKTEVQAVRYCAPGHTAGI